MGLGWQHMDDCGRELTEPIDTAMLAFDGDNHPFCETDLHSRMLGWTPRASIGNPRVGCSRSVQAGGTQVSPATTPGVAPTQTTGFNSELDIPKAAARSSHRAGDFTAQSVSPVLN